MKPLLTPPHPPGNQKPTSAVVQGPASGSAGKSFSLADLKHWLHIVVRRIWLVALCFVISLSVSVVMLMKQIPVYKANATILLRAGGGIPLPGSMTQNEARQLAGVEASYIATQQQIARSKAIADRARERMNYPASEIDANIRGLNVVPVWRTALMSIQVTSLDPVIGAAYANAIARAFIDFKSEQHLGDAQEGVVGLTRQANRLREELLAAEEKLLQFRKENRVVGISEKGNIAEQTMSTLAARAAAHRTERLLLQHQQPLLNDASSEVVFRTISDIEPMPAAGMQRRGEYLLSSSEDPNSAASEQLIERGVVFQPTFSSYKREQAVLLSELEMLRTKYRDAHPKLRKLTEQLADVNRRVEIELDFAQRQFESRLESLRIQEEAASQAEKEWEAEALQVSRKAMEYRTLEKEADRLQRLYDLMFDRLREMDVRATIQYENVRITEEAVPARSPMTARKLQNLFLSALIGIGIGLGLVIGLEFIDDSVRYPEEVSSGLGLPFFGVIPSAQWDPDDLSTHVLSNLDQRGGLAEAYRNIRSSILFSVGEHQSHTMAFVSAVPKEGKTTTSLNMSVSLAQAGSRVLLVDADMRRGELHKFFGLEGGRGLSDVLAGQAKPESVIQRTAVPNLDLVATGPFPPNPAEIILRPEFESFMEYVRRNYDRVIFDCPPVMAVSESAILASMVDGVVFVVWGGHTSKKLAWAALRVLRERGCNLVGCVLNNLEFGRVGYYYYAGYYGYYDDYYGDEGESKSSQVVI